MDLPKDLIFLLFQEYFINSGSKVVILLGFLLRFNLNGKEICTVLDLKPCDWESKLRRKNKLF